MKFPAFYDYWKILMWLWRKQWKQWKNTHKINQIINKNIWKADIRPLLLKWEITSQLAACPECQTLANDFTVLPTVIKQGTLTWRNADCHLNIWQILFPRSKPKLPWLNSYFFSRGPEFRYQHLQVNSEPVKPPVLGDAMSPQTPNTHVHKAKEPIKIK